jgi:DNA polymerase III epsilon subunit-like protein
MPILFFDTETTGKIKPRQPLPDIVQLAAVLTDDDLNEIVALNNIVYPTYWTISDEVAAIHGISHAKAEAEGLALPDVMSVFLALTGVATKFVIHNAEYDVPVIENALARIKSEAKPFEGKPPLCTMRAAKPVLKLPNRNPYVNDAYKFPSLSECHKFFFQEDFDGAHDALVDVRATIKVYGALCRHYGMDP